MIGQALEERLAVLDRRLAAAELAAIRSQDRGDVENLFSRYMHHHNAFEDEVGGRKVWAHWVWCKYGVDFLKQDGQWRIWKFRGGQNTRRTPSRPRSARLSWWMRYAASCLAPTTLRVARWTRGTPFPNHT